MIPPPEFSLIEVELPDLTKLKELEEELKIQKKLFEAFQSWQERVEFALEQNGIILGESLPTSSPNIKNDSPVEGMKIISIRSLSPESPLKPSVVGSRLHCGGNSGLLGNSNSRNLDESDNVAEIGVSRGVNHRPSAKPVECTDKRNLIDISPVVATEIHTTANEHVELPTESYPALYEEETETETIKESYVQISEQASSNREMLNRVSYSSSTVKSVKTTSCSSPRKSSKVVQSKSASIIKEQKKSRFGKDQEEALNHIGEIVVHGKVKYQCKLCNHVGSRETSVLTHIRMSHIGSERKFPCPYCSYRFKKPMHLQQHVQLKHPDRPPCELPPSSLNIVLRREDDTFNIVKGGVKEKRLEVSSKRNHNAAFGTKGSSRTNGTLTRTQEDLEREIRSNYEIFRDNSVNSYLCIACGLLFDEEAMIRQHIIQTHKCAFCPEVFTSSEQLENHMSYCSATGPSNSKKVYSVPSTHAITMGPSIQNAESDQPRKRQYSFPEEIRQEVDKYVSNIQNSRPPYICNICHLIIKSTRQSARIHVRSQHSDLLQGI